jgi:hypothetical protein
VILRLRQNPRAILARRERHIKLQQNPGRERADLHVSQVLADAAKGPHGEGREGVLVLDQLVALAVPALGQEGGRFGVDAVVYILLVKGLLGVWYSREGKGGKLTSTHDILRHPEVGVAGNKRLTDVHSFLGRGALQARGDWWVEAEGFVDGAVEVRAVLDVLVAPFACRDGAELLSDLFHLRGFLGEVVEQEGQRGCSGIGTGNDNQACVGLQGRIMLWVRDLSERFEQPAHDVAVCPRAFLAVVLHAPCQFVAAEFDKLVIALGESRDVFENPEEPHRHEKSQRCHSLAQELESPVLLSRVEHAVIFAESQTTHGVKAVEVEPFCNVDGPILEFLETRHDLVVEVIECRLVFPESLVRECRGPDSTALVVKLLRPCGVHGVAWRVAFVPRTFGGFGSDSVRYLHTFWIDDAEIVRANADNVAMLVVECLQLLVTVSLAELRRPGDVAQPCPIRARETVQRVEEETVNGQTAVDATQDSRYKRKGRGDCLAKGKAVSS